MHKQHDDNKNINFSIMLGGPLYQFYLRSFLAKPPLHLYKRRIIAITLFCWLPLLLLALLGGTAFSGVKVPFLFDLEIHVRFLISLGLLIGAEVIAHQWIQIIVNQFIECHIITSDARKKFDTIIASALKLRNSYLAELLLFVLVYIVGHFIWQHFSSSSSASWYTTIINGQKNLTMAGYWYVYISIPIFQFILCRWYFRVFIWYRFLWQVSRLPLNLNSLHPDRTGGLGFLSMNISALKTGLLAHSVLLAGLIANRIWHAGQTLPEFTLEITSISLFLLFLALIPFLFFILPLSRAKRTGLTDFGIVASDYVNDFRSKWLENISNDTLLGSPDIQSLADLSNSFNVAKEMRVLACSRNSIIEVVLLTVLPLFPLLFTTIPFMDMIHKLIQILL